MSQVDINVKHHRKSSLLAPVDLHRKKSVVEQKVSKLDELKREIEIDEHKLSPEELFRRFNSNEETGLSSKFAEELLAKNGPNALTPPKQTPEWIKFIKQMEATQHRIDTITRHRGRGTAQVHMVAN